MSFKVIKSLSVNKVTPGDMFLINGVERLVVEIKKKEYLGPKVVVLLNHLSVSPTKTEYELKLFNRWLRMDLRIENMRGTLKAQKERLKKMGIQESKGIQLKGSIYANNALRYIIFTTDNSKYQFYFANEHTSHSELFQEVRDRVSEKASVRGGGFYTSTQANAKNNLIGYSTSSDKQNCIFLFGKSDSYGLSLSSLNKAIKDMGETRYKIIVLDSVENHTVITNFDKEDYDDGLPF